MLEPNSDQLAGIVEWLQVATTYGNVGVDLDVEYFLEGLAYTDDWIDDDILKPLRTQVRDAIEEKRRNV